MAKGNFDAALKIILKHEGGFVNHPRDPGGITNLGVTKRTYEAWIGELVSEDTMRSLTPEMVAPIYKVNYWDAVKGDQLPTGLDLCLFDFGVNAGPRRAAKKLQGIIGAGVDGAIGPNTLGKLQAYIDAHGMQAVIEDYTLVRQRYYESLQHFDTFGRGWTRRNNEVKEQALQWCGI